MVSGISVSLIVFATSIAVLLYSLLAFAHVRVTDGDMAELDRLRMDGVLPVNADPVAEYYIIRDKLAEVAPAVCMRQEFWLQVYYHLLRLGQRRSSRRESLLRRELVRLNAYQASHYRMALMRLDAIRNPAL